MAFSGFAEMFVRFAKVLCFNVPSPFFSLSQFFVVSLHKIISVSGHNAQTYLGGFVVGLRYHSVNDMFNFKQ